jgi:hypothetical protein
MLNWNGFCSLLMIVLGPLSAFGSVRGMKAGMSAAILFAFFGLLVGFGMSAATFKFENWSVRRPRGFGCFILGLFVPAIGLVATLLIPALVALVVYGHK